MNSHNRFWCAFDADYQDGRWANCGKQQLLVCKFGGCKAIPIKRSVSIPIALPLVKVGGVGRGKIIITIIIKKKEGLVTKSA